jgi:2-polyprenyl-6-methoxyphenol hydroxylase-like FAD-dependent oxidoreductase
MRGKHFYRMVASVPPSAPQPEHSPNQAFLQAILDTRGPGSHTGGPTAQIDEVWMSSRYRPRNALADRFYMPLGAGHIMLAGDAAHVHSPAGGQGMNISLADGILLAGAIQETIENGNAKPLEEWNKERRAVAREMITVTTGLTRFTNQPSWFMVVLRWTMRFIMWIPGVQRRMLWRSSGLIYRK